MRSLLDFSPNILIGKNKSFSVISDSVLLVSDVDYLEALSIMAEDCSFHFTVSLEDNYKDNKYLPIYVEITPDDIRFGEKKSVINCPAGIALNNKFDAFQTYVTEDKIIALYIDHYEIYKTPLELKQQITHFDISNKWFLKNFTINEEE